MAEEEAKSLQTPDPIMSTEGIAAFVVALVANIYILFGADGMTEEKKTALATVVTSVWIVFVLVHAALVRKGRAAGGGLVSALIQGGPIESVPASDPGDVPPPAPKTGPIR